MNTPSDNSHKSDLRSPLQSELVWTGKYNEHGDRHEVPPTQGELLSQPIYQRLKVTPEQIAAFCKEWHIYELALFGSVLRDDFRCDGDDPSDIDLLYIHSPNTRYGFAFFDMKEELEKLFGRKVDLVSERGIQNSRNWLRRKSILESKQVIYAERSTINH